MANINFQLGIDRIRRSLNTLDDDVHDGLKATMNYHALEGTAHMKENAPWTDRTTAARNGLHATTEDDQQSGKYAITFAHSVPYGIWLEIANSGRYQIIMPTVRHESELLQRRLKGLLGRLGRGRRR